jgi:ABC-type lipoprotein release transport system permease subunit
VITQDAVLATFDKLLRALTAAVAGIAAISLAVAGILVMNVMLVAVTQRTAEIGLLKALGARGTTIRDAFMAEAAMLSLVGAFTGYGLGLFGAFVLRLDVPGVPRLPAGLGGDRRAGHGARHRPAVRHHAGAPRGPARSGAGLDEALAACAGRLPSHLAIRAITAQRLRSFLTLLGIAVGIAAVILLTSIGEGIHRFVLAEFTQFGTNVIGVHPGKTKTGGGPLSGLPSSARPLSLDDAEALKRLPNVVAVTPSVWGNAEVQWQRPRAARLGLRRRPRHAEVFKGKVRSGSSCPTKKPAARARRWCSGRS